MDNTYEITRGDRQRIPSSDTAEWITLREPATKDPLDLTGRDVSFALTTRSSGGDRIALTNTVDIHDDPTTGQVAIVLESDDTAIPMSSPEESLYGEFRVTAGPDDPTTPAPSVGITVHRSRHDVETEADMLTLSDPTWGDLVVDGVVDAVSTRLSNLGDPTDPQDATTQSWVQARIAEIDNAVTSVYGRTGDIVAQSGDYSVDQITNALSTQGGTITGSLGIDESLTVGTNTELVENSEGTTIFRNNAGETVFLDSAGLSTGSITVDQLNGVEQIRDASDLPDPVNGFHELENKVYQFHGTVESDAGLRLAGSSALVGHSHDHCWFIHHGGGTAITGDGTDVIASNLSLSAPGGTIFNVDGGPDTNLFLDHVMIADDQEYGNTADLGRFGSFPDAAFQLVEFRDFDQGLTFDGVYHRIFIECKIRDVTASNVTVFRFADAFEAEVINISMSDFEHLQSDTEITHVDSNATISEVFLYKGNGHDPSVTKSNILAGKADPSTSPYWVSSSFPLRNSGVVGEVSLSEETTATIPAQNEWVEVTGPTSEGNETQRTSGDGTGGVTYTGRKDTNVQVNISASWAGSNGSIYEFGIGKNGSVEPASVLPVAGGGSNSNKISAISGIEDITNGDTISLMVRNTSGTGDLTITRYIINFIGS